MTVNSSSHFEPNLFQGVVLHYLVPICFALITVCGVLGNALVITVYAANRSLQDSTYALIINLAIADLMFLVLCVPFTAVLYATGSWPFGQIYCYINNYLVYVSAYASVWTLVLLAFDRYIAVVHAMSAFQIRTTQNSLWSCACLWMLICLINLPVLYTTRYRVLPPFGDDPQNRIEVCEDNYQHQEHNTSYLLQVRLFYFGFNCMSFILPLGITCLLYLKLVQRLWQNTLGSDYRTSHEALKRKKRVTKLVAIVTLTFAICWLPQNLRYAHMAYVYPDEFETELPVLIFQVSAHILAYTNSCVNPILFGLVSENFRKGFRALFCRKRPDDQHEPKLTRKGGKRHRTHKERKRLRAQKKQSAPAKLTSPGGGGCMLSCSRLHRPRPSLSSTMPSIMGVADGGIEAAGVPTNSPITPAIASDFSHTTIAASRFNSMSALRMAKLLTPGWRSSDLTLSQKSGDSSQPTTAAPDGHGLCAECSQLLLAHRNDGQKISVASDTDNSDAIIYV